MPYYPIHSPRGRIGCGSLILIFIVAVLIYLIIKATMPDTTTIVEQVKSGR